MTERKPSPCSDCICNICNDDDCHKCDICQARYPIKECDAFQEQIDEYDGAEYGN